MECLIIVRPKLSEADSFSQSVVAVLDINHQLHICGGLGHANIVCFFLIQSIQQTEIRLSVK